VATLLVTPEQSEKLALASSQGKLLLTLRGWTDEGQVETQAVDPVALLDMPRRAAAPAEAPKSEKRRSSGKEEKVAAAPSGPAPAHVEILRGDRFEERKFESKEKP
jgi:pilus assembly protein CpaB